MIDRTKSLSEAELGRRWGGAVRGEGWGGVEPRWDGETAQENFNPQLRHRWLRMTNANEGRRWRCWVGGGRTNLLIYFRSPMMSRS